jgi:hypothetical protein
MDETSLFWKRMFETIFIYKEAKSVTGFEVYVSTLWRSNDDETPNEEFLWTYSRR